MKRDGLHRGKANLIFVGQQQTRARTAEGSQDDGHEANEPSTTAIMGMVLLRTQCHLCISRDISSAASYDLQSKFSEALDALARLETNLSDQACFRGRTATQAIDCGGPNQLLLPIPRPPVTSVRQPPSIHTHLAYTRKQLPSRHMNEHVKAMN